MPTYDYFCKVCQKEFEIERSISDDSIVECPECKVACSNRLISSSTPFILNGGGWAKEGYEKKSS